MLRLTFFIHTQRWRRRLLHGPLVAYVQFQNPNTQTPRVKQPATRKVDTQKLKRDPNVASRALSCDGNLCPQISRVDMCKAAKIIIGHTKRRQKTGSASMSLRSPKN